MRAAVAAVRADLADAPFAAPEAHRLAELGLRTRELGAAVTAGALLKVGDGIYLAPDALDVAVARLARPALAVHALRGRARPSAPPAAWRCRCSSTWRDQGRTRRDDEGGTRCGEGLVECKPCVLA